MKKVMGIFILCLSFVFVFGIVQSLAVSYTFHDLSEQQIFQEEVTFVRAEGELFEILNNTGSTWEYFVMTLIGYGFDQDWTYDFMRFVDLGADGVIYDGPGVASFSDITSSGYNDQMEINDLSITDSSMLSFNVDYFGGAFPEGLYSYEIMAQPFVGEQPPPNQPVPEPTTMLLFGTGLLGLIGYGRKKLFKRT